MSIRSNSLYNLIENVFEPAAGNSGTPDHDTVKVWAVWPKVTVPPAPGFRSSHKPAARGGPSRNSKRLSLKSALDSPNVRLPLALTNTESNDWPHNLNVNGRKSCTDPSSPTGNGAPATGALKRMLMLLTVTPRSAVT